MITNGYALYFKDKDGYEIPILHMGVMHVFSTELLAKSVLDTKKEDVNDKLNPKIEYVAKRRFPWSRAEWEPKAPYPILTEHERAELVQMKNTLFIRPVKVA